MTKRRQPEKEGDKGLRGVSSMMQGKVPKTRRGKATKNPMGKGHGFIDI